MPQQPKGKPLDRKAARRQARDEKKQRKAQHYDNKKKFEKQQRKQDWLQRHPEILQKMQQNNGKNAKNHVSSTSATSSKRSIGEGNPKNVPIKKRKIVTPQRAPFMADVTEDPLLAFAERALDEGILGSDGEFDEERMNKLFAGEEYSNAEDEDEEISIDSDDEDYLLGKTRPGNDPADEMDEMDGENDDDKNDDDADEEIDVESDSLLSNDEENRKDQNDDDDEIDVENDSEEEVQPNPNTRTKQLVAPVAAAPSDAEKTLQRTVQGHINKLTMSNFDSVASAIASLYGSHPRHYVTEAVANAITASITKQPNLLDSFILNFAALVAALVHLVGVDFAAVILEKGVPILDQNKALAKQQAASVDEEAEGISSARIVMNTVTLLSYLYDLQVISSLAISNIFDEALVELSELDVEILVKLIRNCRAQLRRDDAMALKDVVSKITARVALVSSSDQSSRFKFMVETIYDLKNNRQKLVAVQHSELESIKKILRNILTQNNISKLEPLHVSLSDVRSIKSKGAWWRVGAAWNPEAGPKTDMKDNAPVKSRPKDSQESKLLELAKKQGMNTDIRRSIFVTLLSSEDYLDAFHRLIALKLTGKQEKEVAYVLLHCCLHERNYNPFYALVASKFTESRHNFVITFKYSLWDRLKEFSEEADEAASAESKKSLREKIHAAKFYGYLMAKQNLPLSALKRASFTQLSGDTILFMQVLLITVMEAAPDEVDLASIFGEIAQLAKGKGSSKKKHRGHADEDDDLFGPDADADGREEKNEDQELLQKQELEALQVGLRLFVRQYLSLSGSTAKHISSIISNKEQFAHRLQIVLSSLQ